MVTLKTIYDIEMQFGLEGSTVVRGFLQTIFDAALGNQEDWKGPIDNTVFGMNYDLDLIRHAVVFFTGNPDCKVTREGFGVVRVTTKGYRAGPCA